MNSKATSESQSQVSISVVSVCFNNPEELRTSMASVDRQTRKPDEHLIINGSTTPDIAGMLAAEPSPSYRRWINEPDDGISDAFNKGVTKSRYEIIHLLNSGDYYPDDRVLEDVAMAFSSRPERQWIHGQYWQLLADTWILTGAPLNRKALYKGMAKTGHPTFFVRRGVYERNGIFSTRYRYSMDYEFLLRIAHEHYAWMRRPLSVFTPGGNSNTVRGKLESRREVNQAYREHFGDDPRLRLSSFKDTLFYKVADWKPVVRLMQLKSRFT